MTCSSLGPRGDEKSGCREDWLAYCSSVPCKSHIGSFRANRFNNFFQGAAAIYHHRLHICSFLGEGFRDPNLKLSSVLADNQCSLLAAIMRAIGIIYHKMTEPYWALLESNTQHVDFHNYVQLMVACFDEWAKDPSILLKKDSLSIFPDFLVPMDSIIESLYGNQNEYEDVTILVLKELMKGFCSVAKRQLTDFLPDGRYSSEPTPERREALRHCSLTNLVGEFAFGDLDYSQNKLQHASLHHHSTLHLLKRNLTLSD